MAQKKAEEAASTPRLVNLDASDRRMPRILKMAEDAATTASLVNLDASESVRRMAFYDAAEHLKALADLPELTPAAYNVVRVMMGHPAPLSDQPAYFEASAEKLEDLARKM